LKNLRAKVLYSDKFLDRVGLFFKIGGISLFPFVILREKYRDGSAWWISRSKKIINHENIHFQQQLELLVIPFYVLYVLMYIWNAIKYGFDIKKAYYQIPFEQEAFENEKDYKYLTNRKRFNWLKYF